MRICGRKPRWDFFERRLSAVSRRYALFVADHPWPFIVVPLMITAVAMGGFAFMTDYIDAGELYTPQDAISRTDQRRINSLFPQRDGSYVSGRMVLYRRECSVVILARDGGNILKQPNSDAVQTLNDFIQNNISITVDGRNYTYQNLCMRSDLSCEDNAQVNIIPLMFRSNDAYTNLSFPITSRGGETYYLGATLGGVTLDKQSRHILDAKAWFLTYKLDEADGERNTLSKLFEHEFLRRILNYTDPLLEIRPFHSQSLDLEVLRNSDSLRPRFTLMLLMLIVFAVLCTLTWTRPTAAATTVAGEKKRRFVFPVVDWTLSRPMLAFLGVVGAGMGVASAIGFLLYGRVLYNNLVAVMPFLIIAVRLDNTFLMIAALDQTARTMPVRERISEAMAEAAVSITITVLTDIFSFSFGVLTDFLAVQIFSIYTTVAIVITWLYQLSFLLGFLVIYARFEEKHRHAVVACVSTSMLSDYDSVNCFRRFFCLGSRRTQTPPSAVDHSNGRITNNAETKTPIDAITTESSPKSVVVHNQDHHHHHHDSTPSDGTAISRWFRDVYGRFLMKKTTKCGVIGFLLLFWAVSIYGCTHLRQGLEPIRLLVDDSYGIPYYYNVEKYFWDYGQQVQIVAFNPGDLTNASRRREVSSMVYRFADLPHATGREGVEFWLTAFEKYLDRNENIRLDDLQADRFYDKLNWFLFSLKANYRYRVDVAFKNGTGPGDRVSNPIVALRAAVGIRGFGSLMGQQETMDSFRSLAAKSDLDISTFHIMFLFVDQYEDIWPNVLQEVYSSIACMIGISLLLIPHPVCAIWVTFAILSIDVGVVGFMTLWGLNMDTISMITIIMSIGFSVDFSAHIAYAYVINIQESPNDRVCKALGTLGWPVLQGGAATLLGVIFLSDLQSYMIVSFFKTVFLVIVFGLVHGLVFLPVLLSLLMPRKMCGFQCVRSTKTISTNASSGHEQNGRTHVVGQNGRDHRGGEEPNGHPGTDGSTNDQSSQPEINHNEKSAGEMTNRPPPSVGEKKNNKIFPIWKF